MDLNLVILSLEYTYLVTSLVGQYESNCGLWQGQLEWSRALIPYTILSKQCPDSMRIIDNLGRLRDTVLKLNHNGMDSTNHVKLVEPQLNNQLVTVSINGNETFVNNSRTELLRAYRPVGYKRIALAPGELKAVGPNFLQRLNGVAAKCQVEYVVSSENTTFKGDAAPSDTAWVYLLGSTDSLNCAEAETRILIDTMLNGCFIDRVRVPLSMIPSLGGANLANFTELARELNINIHLPSLMPQVYNSQLLESNGDMSIWVTLQRVPEIILTKNILADLIAVVDPRSTLLYTQEIEMPRDKLDLISLYHQNAVLALMFKHGTYIQLPSLGEAANNVVVVQGQTKDAVHATAQEVSALSCDFYNLHVRFLRGPVSADFEYYLINLINLKKTCILTYNEHGMSIVGNKNEIHLLLSELVSELQNSVFFTQFVNESDTKFQITVSMELSNDQKEFLSGKKNGKIVKILNQLGHVPTIKFKYLNNYNFLINLSIRVGAGIKDKQILSVFDLLIKTINLIELELPAEMQFNIPEVFHKSIIGNGGSIIQSIMKKYNVFIKFSSDSHNARSPRKDVPSAERILYSLRRNNNVLIKCPTKNLRNIALVKYEIDQLVAQCCQHNTLSLNGILVTYNTVEFRLLKSHYLMLIRTNNYNLRFINDLEAEFGTFIDFPTSLSAFEGRSSLVFAIKGNDTRARQCGEKLASLLPKLYEFQIPYCPGKFDELLSEHNQEFREKVIIPFRLLLGIELVAHTTSGPDTASHQLILSSYNDEKLAEAVGQMTHHLRDNRFLIADKNVLDFDAIVSVSETCLPMRRSHSPAKSPARPKSRSPAKSRSGSPTRQKPLKTITNHLVSNGLKAIPVLNHMSGIMPNFGW